MTETGTMPNVPRVLHILSQRPSLTGSGVTLDALVRHAAEAGWQQRVVVGVPADEPRPEVGGLDPDQIHTLEFGSPELPFPVPGMSDIMPYRSTRWSAMSPEQLEAYRVAWTRRLESVVTGFRPDVVHAHHIWLVGSLIKDFAPEVPVVSHCHATGLRQMKLCPQLGPNIARANARNDHFVVLHEDHAAELTHTLRVEPGRITVVGAGYRDDLFHRDGRSQTGAQRVLYVGKYSAAKGLPWLLDAFERLQTSRHQAELHVAGSGAGTEGDELRRRMQALAPGVTLHGQLDQSQLAALMRTCDVCVLPSFYEGLPLVLIEAVACGCRLVATSLPGVVNAIAPHVESAIKIVDLPRLIGPDTPEPADLPAFTGRLVNAIGIALDAPIPDIAPEGLHAFTWEGVFERIEQVWRSLI